MLGLSAGGLLSITPGRGGRMTDAPGPEPLPGVTLFDRDPAAALKHHFGFDGFRPLQAEIIADVLAGRDVFALLPTGGGKSLCYQLPAVMGSGLTVVVSPLIALMKDQVDALSASGVPATFLNSSLDAERARRRVDGLQRGEYRLLYVAPERIGMHGFFDDLARWGVARFAIDEAHCISEWGHDFRPEYRRLSALRARFERVPFVALTATATERVRSDIVSLLGLRDPSRYVGSFNRPNLTYRVEPKTKTYARVLAFVRERARESGIVYCATRNTAEELARRLRGDGVAAVSYHAGLDANVRARHQEAFRRDDARVVCATIAFGMGIDKPNVRYVIHHDLPKNVEGYYQETGRAGRDGLPSECLLLFSAGDAAKQRHFIDEKPDEHEREIARAQLAQMLRYAEATTCRRRGLLSYFDEAYPHERCDACDNCLEPRATFDGTIAAQKVLSCVYRIRQANGFGVGLNHVVDVLVGADTEKVRKWGHERLSTFGIGSDRSRPEWLAIGRELIGRGLLRATSGLRSVLEVTDEGRLALFARQTVMLTAAPPKPARAVSAMRGNDDPYDDALFEALRTLRRELADERDVPAYVIFSDATLRQMARDRPRTRDALLRVSGVGERKLRDFGAAFLAAIARHTAAPAG
jgi:ATP-dependent DNA helicase RecQ